MIVMLDTPQDLKTCQAEIGGDVEQLLTPLTRYTPQYPLERFAIDNGAYSKFESKSFLSLLEREKHRKSLCRFVAVPDVPKSARRTLEVFEHWKLRLSDWPLAFVCQDGQENLPIPWGDIDAIFIGGSTDWKMGEHAAHCIKAGVTIGKWVHVGRVNTPGRLDYFTKLGADSVDGTGIARYSHMREKVYNHFREPVLIDV